jgi:hypothetical protein
MSDLDQRFADQRPSRTREHIEGAAKRMRELSLGTGTRGALARGAMLGAWLALSWVLEDDAVTLEQRLHNAGVLDA